MSRVLDEMIENGEIYRQRVCARCGLVGYDKLRGWIKEEWRDPEPDFGLSAFSEISVPGRGKTVLCGKCSVEIKKLNADYMRPPARVAED